MWRPRPGMDGSEDQSGFLCFPRQTLKDFKNSVRLIEIVEKVERPSLYASLCLN